ncbi:MAG: aldolase/citrate lyase family protein [bacterium]
MKRIIIVCCLLVVSVSSWSTEVARDVHLNKIIAKLERGEPVIGTWCMSLAPFSAVGLVQSNESTDAESALTTPMIDFVLIAMEHQAFDVETLTVLLMAFNSKRDVLDKGNLQPNICPLVRIPCDAGGPVEPYIKQVLDAGAFGVVVPHCDTARDAERVVKACRYPQPEGDPHPEPAGARGASPWLCSYLWGLTMPEYTERADVWPLDPSGDLLAIIMIESVEAVEDIDNILSVPGIGAIIFGPYDYSFSCGAYGDTKNPKVLKARETVRQACERHNVPLIALVSEENLEQMLEEKSQILLRDTDTNPPKGVVDLIERVKSEK